MTGDVPLIRAAAVLVAAALVLAAPALLVATRGPVSRARQLRDGQLPVA